MSRLVGPPLLRLPRPAALLQKPVPLALVQRWLAAGGTLGVLGLERQAHLEGRRAESLDLGDQGAGAPVPADPGTVRHAGSGLTSWREASYRSPRPGGSRSPARALKPGDHAPTVRASVRRGEACGRGTRPARSRIRGPAQSLQGSAMRPGRPLHPDGVSCGGARTARKGSGPARQGWERERPLPLLGNVPSGETAIVHLYHPASFSGQRSHAFGEGSSYHFVLTSPDSEARTRTKRQQSPAICGAFV
jgi:hypothetical protein